MTTLVAAKNAWKLRTNHKSCRSQQNKTAMPNPFSFVVTQFPLLSWCRRKHGDHPNTVNKTPSFVCLNTRRITGGNKHYNNHLNDQGRTCRRAPVLHLDLLIWKCLIFVYSLPLAEYCTIIVHGTGSGNKMLLVLMGHKSHRTSTKQPIWWSEWNRSRITGRICFFQAKQDGVSPFSDLEADSSHSTRKQMRFNLRVHCLGLNVSTQWQHVCMQFANREKKCTNLMSSKRQILFSALFLPQMVHFSTT